MGRVIECIVTEPAAHSLRGVWQPLRLQSHSLGCLAATETAVPQPQGCLAATETAVPQPQGCLAVTETAVPQPQGCLAVTETAVPTASGVSGSH